MKKVLMAMVACLFLFASPQPIQAKADKRTVTFYVALHCDGCVSKVMQNIAFEKGVKDIVCSIPDQTVVVTYDANKTDIPTLQKAFESIRKPASLTPVDRSAEPAVDEHQHQESAPKP